MRQAGRRASTAVCKSGFSRKPFFQAVCGSDGSRDAFLYPVSKLSFLQMQDERKARG